MSASTPIYSGLENAAIRRQIGLCLRQQALIDGLIKDHNKQLDRLAQMIDDAEWDWVE